MPDTKAKNKRATEDNLWASHKETLRNLYVSQNRSLNDVKEIMKHAYSFDRTFVIPYFHFMCMRFDR